MVWLKPEWWKIYKPPHKTPLLFLTGTCSSRQTSHLTIFLMVLDCHVILSNSVYLEIYQSTLCTCYYHFFFFALKAAPFVKQQLDISHMEGSRATLARADLERDPYTEWLLIPVTRFLKMDFPWLERRVAWKTAGREHTFHVMCIVHNNTMAKNESTERNRHMVGTRGKNVLQPHVRCLAQNVEKCL